MIKKSVYFERNQVEKLEGSFKSVVIFRITHRDDIIFSFFEKRRSLSLLTY